MIIALSGYAKSGKDTVAEMIQEIQPDFWKIKKFSSKLKLIASILTGIPENKFEDQEFKESYLSDEWNYWVVEEIQDGKIISDDGYRCYSKEEAEAHAAKWKRHHKIFGIVPNVAMRHMKVRQFLQEIGTDAIRDWVHTNAWVNALMADYLTEEKVESLGLYMKSVTPPSNWIITDCRFPNEAKAVKDKGGVIVRIDRPGINPVNAHPSETALDNWDFDYKIANVSDLVALKQTVEVLLNKL